MKRFTIEQSGDEFYTSHSGPALVGACINRFSGRSGQIGHKLSRSMNKISTADIVRTMLGLLCPGKSDYEAVTAMSGDNFFKDSLGTERTRKQQEKSPFGVKNVRFLESGRCKPPLGRFYCHAGGCVGKIF